MSKTIALVACVSKKNDHEMPAKDLYISDWFLKASTYAEHNSDSWSILSAKYGLINPIDVIEPYDETLNNMPVRARRAWARRVLDKLLPQINVGDRIVFLAGIKYREHLIPPLSQRGYHIEVPMEGLGIGEQLSWLKKRNLQ